MKRAIRIGCAGWSLRKENATAFPLPGSHLERYARRFDAVEINSSFYRPHRRSTYERWAGSVPEAFRFAVKMPKAITHTGRLASVDDELERFLDEVAGLGTKLGPLLMQLPPSFAFDKAIATPFFEALMQRFSGAVVCEPRHPTWTGRTAAALLRRFHIGRVAADPVLIRGATAPAAYGDVAYYRLHGAPRVYYSEYDADTLASLAARMRKDAARTHAVWCIFDNTAAGAAIDNALELQSLLDSA